MTERKRFNQVYLEITNRCNLRCPFCPGTARPAAFMKRELFRRIIAQLPELTNQVYFHVMGEPLLHPDFAAFIADCGALPQPLPVAVTTNGSRLGTPAAEALLHPDVRQVNISLHSLYPLAGTAAGEQRLAEIFAFTRQAMIRRPDLYLNFRLWNLDTIRDNPSERNLWLLQQIRSAFPDALPADTLPGGHKSRRLSGRLYLSLDTVFAWPEIRPDTPKRTFGFCHGLVDQLAILVDGTVVPCCLDREGVINLGNVAATPLAEILAAPRTATMRNGFTRGELVEELCRYCTFRTRFKRNPGTPSEPVI